MKIISRKEAKEKGLKTYFTGKPCKRGHIAPFLVSNSTCTICSKENSKKATIKSREKDPVYQQRKEEERIKREARQKAIENGETTYFTGIPCSKGHVSPRITSSQTCVQCSQEWKAQDRKNNLEKHKKWRRNDYVRHKDMILSQQKKYREENWEIILERRRKPDGAHNVYMRSYLRDYIKRDDQRGKFHSRIRKRQMQKKKALPSWFNTEKHLIQNLYEESAKLTRETGIKHHVDHIIPLQNDFVCGLHCLANLQILTAEENGRKSNSFTVL